MINRQNWKLRTNSLGRQVWDFVINAKPEVSAVAVQSAQAPYSNTAINSSDLIYRSQRQAAGQVPANESADPVFQSALKAVNYYQTLQADSGHWPGDYGGPLFLTPGLIIASYVTETPLPDEHCELIKEYFLNHQNPDGGWGLHIEGPSTMFGTVLQYVSLRILGMNKNDARILKAKTWIHQNGGATAIPAWGKFYLSVMGVYKWKGVNSLLPEMCLLPDWLSIHPSHYWCHARMVYLPMAYCYSNRLVAKTTVLTHELRTELYTQDYGKINWAKARNSCAKTDLYYPQSVMLKAMNTVLSLYEKLPVKGLRKKATNYVLSYINAEDEQTNFIDIGPVNQAINSICVWHSKGKDSPEFKKHVERWYDYLWLAEDGMNMNGYNGSQLWDTVFAIQAIMEGGFEKYFPETIRKAFQFIDTSQIKEEVPQHKKFYRHDSVGGWPFSTVEHGWPITDCTAEGLKVALKISKYDMPNIKPIPEDRLKQAAELLLSLQNKDGGWASYELTRGPRWLELLNPSEIFGNIMIDYSYTECTSACVQGLITFRDHYPAYNIAAIERAIKNGIDFILSQQKSDGSWYGSWAVCFTYGTWFGVEALVTAIKSGLIPDKEPVVKKAIDKACSFLISKQNTDGGWGESFESCIAKEYVPHRSSQIINTSWALLLLMAANYADKKAIDKGIALLISRQYENGDFPQESISGVFNHNCAISYTAYRNVFPIWALGRKINTIER